MSYVQYYNVQQQYKVKIKKSKQIAMKNQTESKKHKNPPSFIRKLTDMLHNKKHQHIVSWTADHSSFAIKCIIKFTQEILPFYYKHRNYASFIKQLNMYNFAKVQQSHEGENVYKHKYFKKSHPEQLELIKRRNPLRKLPQEQGLRDGENSQQRNQNTVDMTEESKWQELYKMKQKLVQLEMVCKKLFIENDFITKEMAQYLDIIEQKLRLNHQKMQNLLYLFLLRTENSQTHDDNTLDRKQNIGDEVEQQQQQQGSSLPLIRFQIDDDKLKKMIENILENAELHNFPTFFIKFLEQSFGVPITTKDANQQYLKLCFIQQSNQQRFQQSNSVFNNNNINIPHSPCSEQAYQQQQFHLNNNDSFSL